MKTATPQETYDHMLGAGGTDYSWWTNIEVTAGHDFKLSDLDVPEDWSVDVTCEDGEDSEKTAIVDHRTVLAAARRVMNGGGGQYVSEVTRHACRALIFDADECDFDAATSDELLQVIVLGKVVFG